MQNHAPGGGGPFARQARSELRCRLLQRWARRAPETKQRGSHRLWRHQRHDDRSDREPMTWNAATRYEPVDANGEVASSGEKLPPGIRDHVARRTELRRGLDDGDDVQR
jgi:hypothetical protein